jgi:multidrug efflux pump
VPTMYLLFARSKVPGANKARTRDEVLPHHEGDLIAK